MTAVVFTLYRQWLDVALDELIWVCYEVEIILFNHQLSGRSVVTGFFPFIPPSG